jgi:hypothetical protein
MHLTKNELIRLHDLVLMHMAAQVRYLKALPLDAGLTSEESKKRDQFRIRAKAEVKELKPLAVKLSRLIRNTPQEG